MLYTFHGLWGFLNESKGVFQSAISFFFKFKYCNKYDT